MRKTMRTRVFPILLALMMVLALIPATANAADIQAGTPTITPNIGVSNGTTVGFAGEEWWVIGNASSGVYQQTDSVTLLHKGTGSDPEAYGNTAFRTGQSSSFSDSTLYGSYYYANNPSGTTNWTDPNEYRGSTLQQRMESIADGINTASPKEYSLINPRTLTANDDTNQKITGGDVAAQELWALSYDEANTINSNTVRSYGNWWWLRSPGSNASNRAANVYTDGSVDDTGIHVPPDNAVRPAFNLNLSSVLFTSAAAGGKSDATVGSGLFGATAPTAGKLKFTMEDSTNQNVEVIATTAQSTQSVSTSGTLSFSYAGATAGTNQYVSCVLEQSGAVKYYGKLTDSSGAASGSLSIPLTGVLDGTYTLKIFSEEANGENNTDFCSTPITMTLTVSGGTGTVSNFGGTVLSNNAGLASVAGETITTGGGDGSAAAQAKTASINVVNGVTSVALADVVTSNTSATAHIYSADDFTSNADTAISLTEGGATHVYITVTSEDLYATLYYDVTVNRADPPDTTAPTLSNVDFVERTSDTAGKITVTSDEAGTVYYKAVADNASVTQPTAAADLSSWASAGAITASTATEYSVILAAGAQDVYAVAIDATGNISLQSKVDFAAYVPPPTPAVPDAPTAVTAVAGDGQATLSFTPPASDGGSPITTYIVTATPVGGGTSITATFTTNPLTVLGLTNGVTYTFTVVATNAVGLGAESATSSPVTPKYATPFSVTKHFGTYDGTDTVSATVDHDHALLSHLVANATGETVAASNYSITQGSTIITLTEAYLKTLSNGTHWYVAEFSDGRSENIRLNVNVNVAPTPTPTPSPAPNNPTPAIPQTGDALPIGLVLAAAFLSLGGLVLVLLALKCR